MNYFKKSAILGLWAIIFKTVNVELWEPQNTPMRQLWRNGRLRVKKSFCTLDYFQSSQYLITFKPILKSLSLSKFQVEPVLLLIDKLMFDVTKTDVELFSDRLKTNVELWPTLINLGKKFIPAACSPLGI